MYAYFECPFGYMQNDYMEIPTAYIPPSWSVSGPRESHQVWGHVSLQECNASGIGDTFHSHCWLSDFVIPHLRIQPRKHSEVEGVGHGLNTQVSFWSLLCKQYGVTVIRSVDAVSGTTSNLEMT